jgi:cyclopropane fatty-acyl-phospholipid synthase-like methyltransferase
MKPATDPTIDYKRLVAQGYDQCAGAYEQARREAASPEIKWLKKQLPNKAQVLDIGCGSGLPVTRDLAKRFDVTGAPCDLFPQRHHGNRFPGCQF